MLTQSDAPMSCPKCGSTHFEDVQFNQYRKGSYATIPVLSTYDVAENGPTIHLCLCGYPMGMAPGKWPFDRIIRKNFEDSWKKALAYRAKLERETLEAGILQDYATRAEAQLLERKLSRLLEIVEGTDSKGEAPPAVGNKPTIKRQRGKRR